MAMNHTSTWATPLAFENLAGQQTETAFSLAASVLALIVSAAFAYMTTNYDGLSAEDKEKLKQKLERVEEIGEEIHQGAQNFMITEFKFLGGFVLLIFVVLSLLLMQPGNSTAGVIIGCAFIFGAMLSATAGFVGMSIATKANMQTCYACIKSMQDGLSVAFKAGAVMGFAVVGLSLFGLSLIVLPSSTINPQVWKIAAGFGFGGSAIALFARVGGGVYTKAADVGADLVGKVEAGIPEDDPANPAVIADNVGDNVGDVAGMGADLFESYSGGIIAACTIACTKLHTASGQTTVSIPMQTLGVTTIHDDYRRAGIAAPFWICGFGIIAALIGALVVRTDNEFDDIEDKAKSNDVLESLLWAIRRGIWGAMVLQIGFMALACWLCFGATTAMWRVFLCCVIGLLAGVIIGEYTEYVTSYTQRPTQSIAIMSQTGPATVIIQGLGEGMLSTVVPTICLALTIILSYVLAHQYGIAMAAVGMLSTLGVTLATDAYGPVADNAGGIAEMAELPDTVRENTDALDAMGNTTAATGKGFAIGSAVLTAAGLFTAFMDAVGITTVNIADPQTLVGVLIGAMLPFVFAALTMLSVGRSAKAIMFETRRQFQLAPALKKERGPDEPFQKIEVTNADGEKEILPDSAKCVAIATASAIREMVVPGTLAVFMPAIVGYVLSARGLAGMLMGALTAGFMLGITMNNAGGAWDNSKKWVEKGGLAANLKLENTAESAGKGSEMHKAVVVGDTVGDPFKDTSGPALNILIKLMTIVSLVLADAFNNVNPNAAQQWATNSVIIGVVLFVVVFGVLFLVSQYFDKINREISEELEKAALGGGDAAVEAEDVEVKEGVEETKTEEPAQEKEAPAEEKAENGAAVEPVDDKEEDKKEE